jgi:hypothetical protein
MATALTAVNRESELSYAYLHAIASHAGVNCKTSKRAVIAHLDDRALVRIAGRLRPGRQPRTMTDGTSFNLIGSSPR